MPEAINRPAVDKIETIIVHRLDRTKAAAHIAAAPHPTADSPRPKSDPGCGDVGAADLDCLHPGSPGVGQNRCSGLDRQIARVKRFSTHPCLRCCSRPAT